MKQMLINSRLDIQDFGLLYCALLCLLIGFSGCGDDDTVIVPGADEIISQGWKEYVTGNYEDAIAKFQDALEKDLDSSEAYNGIGWSRARLGQLNESINEFKRAVTKDSANTDAHVGLAGMYFVDADYEQAIASAKRVLLLQPEYESQHDDINTADIHILLAECYYNTGAYAEAKAEMEIVGGSGQTPDSSNLAGLLSFIEELSER